MKVSIKKLEVPMDVKNNGVEFEVKRNGRQVGDLVVTRAYVTWCRGRTAVQNGKKVPWNRFIQLMESEPAPRACRRPRQASPTAP